MSRALKITRNFAGATVVAYSARFAIRTSFASHARSLATSARTQSSRQFGRTWMLPGIFLSTAALGTGIAMCAPDEKKSETDAPVLMERPERSEPRPTQPCKPGDVCRAVADTVTEIVLDNDHDVLIKIYEEGCDTCAMLKHVVEQVAWALRDVPTVRVVEMDGWKNYKKGFLTEEESKAFPLIKVYPAGAKDKSAEWPEDTHSGRYTASTMIRFIHKHAKHKFDLDKALAESAKHDKVTEKLMRKHAGRIVRKASTGDPEMFLFANAPCRKEHNELTRFFFYGKYSDLTTEDRFDNMRKRFFACQAKNSAKSAEYWQHIEEFAKQMGDQAVRLGKEDPDSDNDGADAESGSGPKASADSDAKAAASKGDAAAKGGHGHSHGGKH